VVNHRYITGADFYAALDTVWCDGSPAEQARWDADCRRILGHLDGGYLRASSWVYRCRTRAFADGKGCHLDRLPATNPDRLAVRRLYAIRDVPEIPPDIVPLAVLCELCYVQYLILSWMSGATAPPDVQHFGRLAMDPTYTDAACAAGVIASSDYLCAFVHGAIPRRPATG
jgi:hypothetical protein